MFRRILTEPLFHFFLLGLAIFAWFWALNPTGSGSENRQNITVTSQQVVLLAHQYKAARRRFPTPDELSNLIDAYVQQEVLVREARALGLDQSDGIIRNRLAQKMTFLATSAAQAAEPSDAALGAFFEDNQKSYLTRERVRFEQVALAQGADAEAAKAALNKGQTPTDLATSILLPQGMALSAEQVVDGTFGIGFFAQIRTLEPSVWGGPVRSGYGLHLIKLLQHQPATVPPLQDIRERVLLDWRKARVQELTEAQVKQMRAQYEISVPEAAEIESLVGQ